MPRFDVPREDLSTRGVVVQIGVMPRRIDVLTSVTGGEFDAVWARRVAHRVDDSDVPFLGREDLIAAKRAAGRGRDRADLDTLERHTR